MIITVQKLADAIFVSKRDPIARDAASELITQALQLPLDLKEVLFAEFASLHLPTFLRVFLDERWRQTGVAAGLTSFLLQITKTNSFAKWFRDSDLRVGLEFGKELTKWLDWGWPTTDLTLPIGSWTASSVRLVACICNLLCVVLINLPLSHPPGHTAASYVFDALANQSLASKLRPIRFQDTWMGSEGQEMISKSARGALAFVHAIAAGKVGYDLFTDSLKDLRSSEVWHSCEMKKSSEAAACVPLQNGEEMMACGKCLIVRYCSRDHQRADWKRHKKVCFRPTWDVREAS